MKIRMTFVEELLGSNCSDKDVYFEHIAKNSKDAEKIKEELEALPAEDLMEKKVTVFSRNSDRIPILWDYQIKGFFKEALGVQLDLMAEEGKPEVKFGKTKVSKWTLGRVVDKFIFVAPRQIPLLCGLGPNCVRPLRAMTAQGPRVALAESETVSAGTSVELEIILLIPALTELIVKCLDYGALSGLGQWRNNGKGRFKWEELK